MDNTKLPLGVEWWVSKHEGDEPGIFQITCVIKRGGDTRVIINGSSVQIPLSEFLNNYAPATQEELAEFFDYSDLVISSGAGVGATSGEGHNIEPVVDKGNADLDELVKVLAGESIESLEALVTQLGGKEQLDIAKAAAEKSIQKGAFLARAPGHLKSLDEHNSRRTDFLSQLNSNEPRPNGIACPDCGAELLDSNPMMTLASNPPKKNINCSKCKYTGYRIC